MDTDKPRMFRRRTDKIYATLQQVQRRITQGTEPGEQPGPETAYTSGPSSYPGASSRPQQPPGMGRTISQAQANSGQGYLVTPDGRRISAEPDTASQATASPSQPPAAPSQAPEDRPGTTPPPVHPMERALHQWDRQVEPPAPPAPMLPSQQAASPPQPQQAYQSSPPQQPASHSSAQSSGSERPPNQAGEASPNPALQMAASSRARPRRIELGIELATVLAIAWLGTVAVAFFLGRQEFTGGGLDGEVLSAAGSQVQGSEQVTPPPGQGGDSQAPVPLEGNGNDILLLQSVGTYSRQSEERFQALADRFNQAAREGNFDPLFDVRQPRSGGLQFVYGKVGTRFGIRRDDQRGRNITAALKDKFPGMKWISLD